MVPFIKSSFDTLLKIHQVMQFSKFVTILADIRTEIPSSEEQTGFRYGTAESAVFGGGR